MKTKAFLSFDGDRIHQVWSSCARRLCGSFLAAIVFSSSPAKAARSPEADSVVSLGGLTQAAQVTRDVNGIAHLRAGNTHDLYFLQGYVHAQDRLFQMDVLRRLGSGTLAELLGEGALPTDVQLRTIGLRRAAERSLPALSVSSQAAVAAYAEGVNAWAAANPLPPEYGALELTQFQPWTALDTVTVAKLIAFNRSFDVDIDPTITFLTYQQAGQALGFDGAALYLEDLFRSAPFDPASTVPGRRRMTARSPPPDTVPADTGSPLRLPRFCLPQCQRYADGIFAR